MTPEDDGRGGGVLGREVPEAGRLIPTPGHQPAIVGLMATA